MFIFLYKSINQYYRDVIKTLDKKAACFIFSYTFCLPLLSDWK